MHILRRRLGTYLPPGGGGSIPSDALLWDDATPLLWDDLTYLLWS